MDQPSIATSSDVALPTDPARRIVALDVLRGAAVLGILVVNISGWAFPNSVMPTPLSFGGDAGLDRWTWIAQSLLVEGAMRGLFAMLFGAGVILFLDRLHATGRPAVRLAVRRLLWLIVFGLVHGYILLWPGDILFHYGLCGFVIVALHRASPRVLVVLALLCVTLMAVRAAPSHLAHIRYRADVAELQQLEASGVNLSEDDQAFLDEWRQWSDHRPSPEVAAEIDHYLQMCRGDASQLFRTRASETLYMQTVHFVRFEVWDITAAMLLGAALIKLGILAGTWPMRFYLRLAVIAFGIGLAVNAWELRQSIASGYLYLDFRGHWITFDVGRLSMALGYMSIIIALVQSGLLKTFVHALGAVGRMALTNYVMHSVICGLLFYGIGFGLAGRMDRAPLMLVVVSIWIVQLIISPLWLRYFAFGPLEWLWRTLTYWTPAPMRRHQ